MQSKPKLYLHQRGWHRWFAWRPVTAYHRDGTHARVWLAPVDRLVRLGYCITLRYYRMPGERLPGDDDIHNLYDEVTKETKTP